MKLVIANWKMNGSASTVAEFCSAVSPQMSGVTRAVCPPFPYLAVMAERLSGSDILLGGQDCHAKPNGAFTGDVSAAMLADSGCRMVIVGHSERRAAYGENDATVAAKAKAAVEAGLMPVICVGESWHERQAGVAVSSVLEGVNAIISGLPENISITIAYEPIWAIGSGQTPSAENIREMHAAIHNALIASRKSFTKPVGVIYGGSVNPGNAAEISAIAEVDGFLVGGASLKADSFTAICNAAKTSVRS